MTVKSDLDARKHRLISRIVSIQETKELEKMEAIMEEAFPDFSIKPLRKNITLDEMLAEQNFRGFDRDEMEKLAEAIDVPESIDGLLALLSR